MRAEGREGVSDREKTGREHAMDVIPEGESEDREGEM